MALLATGSLQAADLYWNPGGTGGDGIWGTGPGEKNWNAVPGAPAGNAAWPDPTDNVAIFQDLIGGVVTVSEALQTAGIVQTGANYSINAGVVTLVPDSTAASPFIRVQGGILGIDSVIAGNNGLIKDGGGTLELTGSNTYTGITQIKNGSLSLIGSLASGSVSISSGASLLDQNGGLSGTATLTNSGSLTLNADDTISSYISNGGTLTAGAGTLFTTSAALNDGSTLTGLLTTTSLTSDGAVQITGTVSAGSINLNSGTLTNTGTLGLISTLLILNQGTTLVAGGSQQYSLLTTSGSGAATWSGDLVNTSKISPGSLGSFGNLAIQGDFIQSSGGTLEIDLSATGHDLLAVTGGATFNGSLELNQPDATAIAPFVPVTIVSAASYAGNIISFTENLEGAVWFNPLNGSVTRVDLPPAGSAFFGATRNQTSTWISLYDDVIDPGIRNIQSGPNGYDITSGIADSGNPDLLWALSASFTPSGLNGALLNRLSPEVYVGASDFAMQATRSHQRSALSAPALGPGEELKQSRAGDSEGGAKAGILDGAKPPDWEFFAAVDYFRSGNESSLNEADSDFEGTGVLLGARTRPWERTQLAAYFGVDSGTLNGALIDAEEIGWNLGVTGEYLLDEHSRTRLRAAMSYGTFHFDGSRQSVSASASGWVPRVVRFDNLDVDAFDLFIGADGIAWKKDALTLIPSAGLRYAMTSMGSFYESTGSAAGSPIALDVSRDRHDSMLLEFGLLAQIEVNHRFTLWGESGVNLGLLDEGRVLTAGFSKGGRNMRTEADGLEDDSLYFGFGAVYQFSENINANIGYRADIRSGAELQQELRFSSSWRF